MNGTGPRFPPSPLAGREPVEGCLEDREDMGGVGPRVSRGVGRDQASHTL
jgi:hypothetical protein